MTPPTKTAAEPPESAFADLSSARAAMRQGRVSALDLMTQCVGIAQHSDNATAFVAQRPLQELLGSVRATRAEQPLAGLAVSVKDLFDVQGEITRAGSRALDDAPPATADAPAVARLKAAGGVVIGRTHMVEFAFSGVGINPHWPTPSARDAGRAHKPLAGAYREPCVPGGSSSGAAVSVACGAAFVGLGSDTGGSIRIPAAFNGLVGFKSTAALVPSTGAIPLSSTLDTVCAMTRSVRDAVVVHEILAARSVAPLSRPLNAMRFAVAKTSMLDELTPAVASAFHKSLAALSASGADVVEIPMREIASLASLQSTGGFSAAESYAWHRQLLAARRSDYDPRVAARIERGARMLAWEYLDLVKARRAWIAQIEAALQGFDAVLSPTVPVCAPTIASLAPGEARDEQFFKTNALLLRNPSVVNMLDGCALSLPCHAPGELPVSLMLWHGAHQDDLLLHAAGLVEACLAAATD